MMSNKISTYKWTQDQAFQNSSFSSCMYITEGFLANLQFLPIWVWLLVFVPTPTLLFTGFYDSVQNIPIFSSQKCLKTHSRFSTLSSSYMEQLIITISQPDFFYTFVCCIQSPLSFCNFILLFFHPSSFLKHFFPCLDELGITSITSDVDYHVVGVLTSSYFN